MAKSLDDRIAAALGPDARAATVASLQTEVKVQIDLAQREYAAQHDLSVSVTATEADAEAAADNAAKIGRRIVRLEAKAATLADRHAEILDSDARRRRDAECAEIEGRRDQLAADLVSRWPALTGEMVELLTRIEASDRECARFNLTSAEAVARGCTPTFWMNIGGASAEVPRLGVNNIQGLDARTHQQASKPVWVAPRFRGFV